MTARAPDWQRCPRCGGTGVEPSATTRGIKAWCSVCGGSQWVWVCEADDPQPEPVLFEEKTT